MLSARALTIQRIAAARRSFATAVTTDAPHGVKVAALDFGQPASTVTVVAKAGSRFQSKEGVANALKNFAFKSTAKRSAIGTIREAELYGGLLSASLSREHLALTAEFLRGDEEFFVDVLSSFITSAKFARWEMDEYVNHLVTADTEAALANPATRALEAAHALAFRSGLGSSLFAPSHPSLSVDDVKAFASSSFAQGNIAVIGTNIDPAKLSKLVESSFAGLGAGAAQSATTASKYFGGETRLEGSTGRQTVFIGFGTSSSTSTGEIATLAAHLSTTPSIKWSKSLSPIAAAIPQGASVQSIYLPYTDASLFGLLVQADSAGAVKEAAKVAVDALKKAAKGVSQEELKSAVARAKFATVGGTESREGLVGALSAKILAGSEVSLDSTLSAFDKVTASSFTQAVSSLVSAKPTLVAVGDSLNLPHADELGL